VIRSQNQTDILAAMKVWAEVIREESGLDVDSQVRVFSDLDQAVAALRDRQVEGLTLSLPEYAVMPPGLLGGPFFRDEVDGSTRVRFALVAARGGPVKGVQDLRDARLVVHDSENSEVAVAWLDAQLAAAGLGRLRGTAAVKLEQKASSAVLGVFFGTADACLVRLGVFESVAELNPQVARRLMVVAQSEPIAPSLFAFRAGVPEEVRNRFVQEVLSLHESTTGQQVMRVFRADRMQEVTADEVVRSTRLYLGWIREAGGLR